MAKLVSLEARQYWQGCWQRARANMPVRRGQTVNSTTALCLCLGYTVYSRAGIKFDRHKPLSHGGVNVAHTLVYVAIRDGSTPSTAKRRKGLELLASPHGRTLARHKLNKLGLVGKFKW